MPIEIVNKDVTMGAGQLGRLWDLGLDIEGSGAGRPRRPAAQVEWVYACLMLIVRTCRDIQLVLSTTNEDIVESGPVYDLLLNNPDMPWMHFITETVGYLALHSEVYWIFTDLEGYKPKTILVAGRDQCKPVIRRGVLVGYELRQAEGRRIPLFIEDVHPILDFNPYDKHHGLGALDAAYLSTSAAYQATQFNEAMLANGAAPGIVLVAPPGVKLDDDQIARMKAEFRARHGGARNAGRAFLATGGVDIKPFTHSMADLQMIDLRRFDANAICAAFGVPPELIGLNPEAQYAHGPAQLRFIQNTIGPILSFLASHITLGLLRRFRFEKHVGVPVARSVSFCGSRLPLRRRASYRAERVRAIQSQSGLFAWFDMSQHPVVQQAKLSEAEKALRYTLAGVTLNDIIEAHDLPYNMQPWGYDWWIGMGQVPASFTLEAGPEELTGPALPEGETPGEEEPEPKKSTDPAVVEKADDEPLRLRIWRSWVSSWLGIEREYSEAMRKFFLRQQRLLLAELKKALSDTKAAKADPDRIIARVVLDLRAENGKIKVIHQAFFRKASELGARQTISEVSGVTGDKLAELAGQALERPAVKRAMLQGAQKITGVNVTTGKLIAGQLRAGLDAGEGLADLAARIRERLGGNLKRAQSIARTQTAGAVGSGRHAGLSAAGVDLKSWLTARDPAVRESHRAAESRYAAGIAVTLPFQVGADLLMYPGDPGGSAGEIINCRCLELPVIAAGKAADLIAYSNLKFYSYADMLKDAPHAAQRD